MNNNKNGFGIASLVIGILSMTILFAGGSVLGLLGLIFGIVSLSQKEKSKGMAIGGIVTSCIGIVIGTVAIIGFVFYRDDIETKIREVMEIEDDWDDDDWDDDDWDDDDWDDDDDDWDDDDWDDDDWDDDDWDDNKKDGKTAGIEVFAGNQYECGDGSVIYFEEDGTYIWYQSDEVHDDNYYYGTYDLYFSEVALDYVTNDLAQFGVTEEELDEYFDMNGNNDFYQLSNFCCLVLHNEGTIIEGENITRTSADSYYMGFYADGYYDAANMSTGNYAEFRIK